MTGVKPVNLPVQLPMLTGSSRRCNAYRISEPVAYATPTPTLFARTAYALYRPDAEGLSRMRGLAHSTGVSLDRVLLGVEAHAFGVYLDAIRDTPRIRGVSRDAWARRRPHTRGVHVYPRGPARVVAARAYLDAVHPILAFHGMDTAAARVVMGRVAAICLDLRVVHDDKRTLKERAEPVATCAALGYSGVVVDWFRAYLGCTLHLLYVTHPVHRKCATAAMIDGIRSCDDMHFPRDKTPSNYSLYRQTASMSVHVHKDRVAVTDTFSSGDQVVETHIVYQRRVPASAH